MPDRPSAGLAAYSSILRGIYDDSARRLAHPVWQTYAGPENEARMVAVEKVAREMGTSGNQVALAWLLRQTSPRVLPLIGPRTWEHYEAIRPAFELELGEEHLALLDGAVGLVSDLGRQGQECLGYLLSPCLGTGRPPSCT
ncbi:aldo/keto reductase [Amycolatopsis sp. NPDC051071]|uniref:aldo/keto reductase n=1 Tax=Amycolatopsis sp. NPDC051071 TaxID=3154637 RepID=UPI003417E919